MASILQKVVRNQGTTRIIASFNKQILTPPFFNHQSEIDSPQQSTINPFFPGRAKPDDLYCSNSSQFYPSFPFGCFLNPISSTGFVESENEDAVDSGMIWADSVKKKRKRKMNKHKLKKLRKRLRRKT